MGKGRNKNKDREASTSAVGGGSRTKSRQTDYSDSDCESVSTHITLDDDMRSVQGPDDADEMAGSAVMDSLCEHMDNATNKNISIRMAALRHLYLGLCSNCLGDELIKYKATLVDLATRAIRKTDEECVAGCQLLAVLAVQLGTDISSEADEPLSLLCPIVTDSARVLAVRSAAALAIGIAGHFCCENESVYGSCIKALFDAWSSFKTGSQYTSLFCSSLSAWCLLLSKAENPAVNQALTAEPRLVAYVEGTQLEMRVSAGEALAFLYELGCDRRGDSFRFPNHDHLCGILGDLASDSGKTKTKKEKRVQKMNFRQIHSFIADSEVPSLSIKLDREILVLDSCAYKLLYDQLTELLRGGMRRHLKGNELLREAFDMGAPVEETSEKMNKQSRLAIQNSINKVREQARSKQRDKRAC